MENIFSAAVDSYNYRKRVPKSLEECTVLDSTTSALNKWAMIATWVSIGIAVFVFWIGVFVGSEAEEFLTFLPFCIIALIVLAVGDFFANLIRGLARIVYHTGITANVALMNVNQNSDIIAETPKKVVKNNISHNPDFGTIPTKTEMDPPSPPVKIRQPSKEVSKLLDELY